MNRRTEHARARREAFGWYAGDPPSPEAARRHFADKAVRNPAGRALYREALDIFLATCWNIQPPDR